MYEFIPIILQIHIYHIHTHILQGMNYIQTRIYGYAHVRGVDVGMAHKEWEMDDGCHLDVVLMNDPLNTSAKPSMNLQAYRLYEPTSRSGKLRFRKMEENIEEERERNGQANRVIMLEKDGKEYIQRTESSKYTQRKKEN